MAIEACDPRLYGYPSHYGRENEVPHHTCPKATEPSLSGGLDKIKNGIVEIVKSFQTSEPLSER